MSRRFGLLRHGPRRLPGRHRVAEPVRVVERQRGRRPVLPLLLDVGVAREPRARAARAAAPPRRRDARRSSAPDKVIAKRSSRSGRPSARAAAIAWSPRRSDSCSSPRVTVSSRRASRASRRCSSLAASGLDRLDRSARVGAEVVRRERSRAPEQGIEALGRPAGALEAARRLGQHLALGGERRRLARPLRRRDEGGAGLRRVARLQPVVRQPRRLAVALLQEGGDLGMKLARDRRRHRSERRLVDQVVREGAVAQHLRRLELGARVGEVERAHAEHVRGELDREVGRRDRRAARQPDGVGRQAPDAPLDHRVQAARDRQPRRQRTIAGAPRRHRPRRHRRERARPSASRAGTADCRRSGAAASPPSCRRATTRCRASRRSPRRGRA